MVAAAAAAAGGGVDGAGPLEDDYDIAAADVAVAAAEVQTAFGTCVPPP